MTAITAWAVPALLGSTVLMLLVLALRGPARRWIGPQLGYALWAFPALRMIVPPLPPGLFSVLPDSASPGARLSVLAIGAPGARLGVDPSWPIAMPLAALWLAGAAALLAVQIGRYLHFRRRLLASATPIGRHGSIQIVAAAVDGPLAFGVLHRFIAVPQDFTDRYDAREQRLVIAHEAAHHARGDLVANWLSLAMLALHWWNPIAWAAIRAFRDDQEFAVDGHILGSCDAATRPAYAQVLAKAAGLGSLAVSHLNARSNLKGRLMMFSHQPLPRNRRIIGGTVIMLLAATALAASVSTSGAAAPATGRQAVTIAVKPDGAGNYSLIVGGTTIAAGASLPGGTTLPSDFAAPGGCDLKPSAKPHAMVIKGSGDFQTYTVMCASAGPAPVRATLGEGLASLNTMRASVATQPASAQFPEAERRHALGAIDRSIREVQAELGRI